MSATLTESQIQKQCLEWLNLQYRWRFWRRNTGAMSGAHNGKKWFMRFGQPGMSDLWGVGPGGRHAEIEIKRRGKKPTLDQSAWLTELQNLGAIGFWCTSLDECIEKFKKETE